MNTTLHNQTAYAIIEACHASRVELLETFHNEQEAKQAFKDAKRGQDNIHMIKTTIGGIDMLETLASEFVSLGKIKQALKDI